MGFVVLEPTAVCPKERFEGAAVISSLLTPDPANHKSTVGSGAFPVNDTFPSVHPVHPVAVGEKVRFNATLCPAARDRGRVRPETLKSEPPKAVDDTVVLVDPVLAI